jgi:asparagine synthase (glutamine-hydrolysing)
LRERGADLLVTGAGGDEVFGGDLIGFSAALRRGNLGVLVTALRVTLPYRPTLRRRFRAMLVGALRPSLPRWLRRMRADSHAKRRGDWVGAVLRKELHHAARAFAETPIPRSAMDRFMHLAQSPNISFVAEERTRNQTMGGLPCADPLYDEDLVRFMTSVPPRYLFVDNSHRGLLRRAMRGLLPEPVRARMDKARFEPALSAMMWPLEGLDELLRFERIGRAEIVDSEAFRRHLAPLVRDPGSNGVGILWDPFWAALAAEAFLAGRENS